MDEIYATGKKHFVVSYNLLSPDLCNKDRYADSEEGSCGEGHRFDATWQKLKEFTDLGAIVCIQELSRAWHIRLLPLFHSSHYAVVFSSYGHAESGYMGIAIAFPDTRYTLVDGSDRRVSDVAAWQTSKPNLPVAQTWGEWLWSFVAPTPPPNNDDADIRAALTRTNTLLTLRLRDDWDTDFVVATYHMPCYFFMPGVMHLHAAAAVNAVLDVANGLPVIFAGDFNMMPSGDTYAMVTQGALTDDVRASMSRTNPSLRAHDVTVRSPMKSAYAEFRSGHEPAFTCYCTAYHKGKPNKFKDTIDYIFFAGDDITCKVVMELPHEPCPLFGASLPSLHHPSDHLAIGAVFKIGKD